MGSTPHSIQSLLHIASPDIAEVLGRARFLTRIRSALLEVLPANAGEHLQIAAYENHRLRLHVDNAAWGTRLRYMAPAIIQRLAQSMRLHIDQVDVRVRPDVAPPAAARVRPREMSRASSDHIRRTARHIDDPALAAALERLAAAGRLPGPGGPGAD